MFRCLKSCWPSKNTDEHKHRSISVGNKTSDVQGAQRFPSNKIVSSKYTFWNFLPKNLFEQFHRIANFYFLIVAFICFFVDTSVSAWTTLFPLIFVVSVTAIKQGYEDWLRHRSDREVNRKSCIVVREGKLQNAYAEDVKVGDIVQVTGDSDVPCDIVMLSSSEEDGSCYITTVNLDGETNLKIYSCPPETSCCNTVEKLGSMSATIECEHPTMDLYKFVGRMNVDNVNSETTELKLNAQKLRVYDNSVYSNDLDDTDVFNEIEKNKEIPYSSASSSSSTQLSLTATNLLLRGTRLKNTEYIFGCAVYTGQETKISLNTLNHGHKYSRIEKKLNLYLIFYIIILIIFSALWVVWAYLFYHDNDQMTDQGSWYMSGLPHFTFAVFVKEFFIFMVLFNYIIPISMYVTVELQKFFGSIFFEWDIDLYDPVLDEHAKANTSDLNEELGQIQYLFTDKTGTLTENEMIFRKLYVNGKFFKEVVEDRAFLVEEVIGSNNEDESGVEDESKHGAGAQIAAEIEGKLEEILISLALCHTVRVDQLHKSLDDHVQHLYQSASPDEKALVEACARLGVVYHGIDEGKIRLTINCRSGDNDCDSSCSYAGDTKHRRLRSVEKIYQLRHVLEFDSSRKKMSVIVEDLTVNSVVGYGKKCYAATTSICTENGVLAIESPECECFDNKSDDSTSCLIRKSRDSYDNDGGSEENSVQNRFKIICKGAETAVLEGVTYGDVEGVEMSVNRFAEAGYRTLVIATKNLNAFQFEEYDRMLIQAKNSLDSREENLTEVFNQIEKGMEVLGATAVEDKLQEDVADTIKALRKAGIQIWVLTGDKEETAVNVSYSAGHMTKDMAPLSLTKQVDLDDCLQSLMNCKQIMEANSKKLWGKKRYALIVDGKSLTFALENKEMSDLFTHVSQGCVTVLCCRLSPIQKASVVALIKNSPDDPTTAAVGDGANDVNMIQEAHVGIGLMGKEGRQAARSSDFALARFKHLKKVILVHGHYFYIRLVMLVMYFFFKNVAMTGVQVYYTFYSAMSAQTIFSGYYLTFYNTTFTALPIVLYGVFEQHIPPYVLSLRPSLYRLIKNNALMSKINFFMWNILGIWHSTVYFFGTYWAIYLGNSLFYSGWDLGIFEMGAIAMTVCVLAVNFKLVIESYHFNAIIVGGFVVSIVGYYLLTVLICAFISNGLPGTIVNHGSLTNLMRSPSAWLITLLLTFVSLIPDLIIRTYRDSFHKLYSITDKVKKELKEEIQLSDIDSDSIINIKSIKNNDWVYENDCYENDSTCS